MAVDTVQKGQEGSSGLSPGLEIVQSLDHCMRSPILS